MLGHTDRAYLNCIQQCPPHKWVDNAEVSAPDQMTNITVRTRLQSYPQWSGQRLYT